MPMYKKLHSTIREFDDDHIILFEPTIIITSVSYCGCNLVQAYNEVCFNVAPIKEICSKWFD